MQVCCFRLLCDWPFPLEIIYGVTFYVLLDWLKNNQSRDAISTSAVPLHVHVFFKLTSLFAFWHQRCNTESWLLTKQATSPCGGTYKEGHPMRDSAHVGTQNSPFSSLWICTDQPPKLHGTERTVTKTNAIVKSAENSSFCNSSSFLFISFSKYKPFFSTKLLSCSFSLVTSQATVSLIFPYTADIDFVLLSTGKIPTFHFYQHITYPGYSVAHIQFSLW